jgi:hypothetical protein
LGGYYFSCIEFIASLNYIIFQYFILFWEGWIIIKIVLYHFKDPIFFVNFYWDDEPGISTMILGIAKKKDYDMFDNLRPDCDKK